MAVKPSVDGNPKGHCEYQVGSKIPEQFKHTYSTHMVLQFVEIGNEDQKNVKGLGKTR
jgi:hypothetical protein